MSRRKDFNVCAFDAAVPAMKDWELFGAVRLGELAARIAGPSRRAWTSASEGRLSATSAGRSQQYPKTEGEHDEKSRCEPTRGICRGKDRTPSPSSDGDQATAEEAKHVGFVLPSWWTSQATGIALVARSQETAVHRLSGHIASKQHKKWLSDHGQSQPPGEI